MYEKMPIKEFIEQHLHTLKSVGYSESTMFTKKRECNQIIEFAQNNDEDVYSIALGAAVLETVFNKQQNNGNKSSERKANDFYRTVMMLNDFYYGLPFKKMYLKPKNTVLSDKQVTLINSFIQNLADKGYAKSSIGVFKRVSIQYFEYFSREGMNLNELGVRDIGRLLTIFQKSSPITIKKNIQILKHLIRFLFDNGEIASDFSEKIPYPRIYRKSNIPSVWPEDELKRIFDVIDTNSAIGKRNRVILLLASRLGLRGSDIRNLKLSDIDWENDTVCFIQSKTKQPITLPLVADVGEAIIDYLRYGRPDCNSKELVLRHNLPFEPFESNTGFNNIIIRYARKAGVKFTSERKHGLHSLRHTFANDLLAHNVSPSIIAGLLGHTSSESVSIYLKAQDEMLRECSLDIEGVIACGR